MLAVHSRLQLEETETQNLLAERQQNQAVRLENARLPPAHHQPVPAVVYLALIQPMGIPSEISLPTNKPDIRPNLGEGVRWSQIRLDQPQEQEGRKEI